jgi:AraC-like DNA-binding protein
MAPRNINRFSLENVDKTVPNGIKNFIITHPSNIMSNLSKDAPYLFNGIVIGICMKGEATINVSFKDYKLEKGMVFIILPSQLFKIVKRSDDFEMESLCFSFDFFCGLVLPTDFEILIRISRRPCITVPESVMSNLLRYHDIIIKQYNDGKKIFRIQIIRGLLYSLFLELASLYKEGTWQDSTHLTRQENVAIKFFVLLMKHYKEERSVMFYADQLCLTRKYLSSIIKGVTGFPILNWINNIVITEIKIRLKTSDLTVLQVSEEFNFPNPSFFGQYFKRHTGMTPHKFRNS